MQALQQLSPRLRHKRFYSDPNLPSPSCIFCRKLKSQNFSSVFFLCFSCKGPICPTCQITLQINGKAFKLCPSCLELTQKNGEFLTYQRNFSQNSEKIRKIEEKIKEIKGKNKENLGVLRELNLSFIQLIQISLPSEREMESRLVKIHENLSELGYGAVPLNKEKARLIAEIEKVQENLENLQIALYETEKLITKDSEKILDLEVLIEDQKRESNSFKPALEKIQSQRSKELEIFTSTESLSSHLETLKKQFNQAKVQNQLLKKRLQELKTLQDDSHPRVSFEARNENYKKMLEQFNTQEIQLKELQLHLKDSPITNSKCKCHIM